MEARRGAPGSGARTAAGAGGRLGLTVDEAAGLLGISRALAYELVADGTIPCLRLRRRIVVPLAAVVRMLDPSGEDGSGGGPTPAA